MSATTDAFMLSWLGAEHSDVLDADEQDAYNDEEFVSMEKFEEENNEITE